MLYARTPLFNILRLLTLVLACATSAAYADDYNDVNQLLRAGKLSEAMAKADSYLASKPRDPQMRFLKGVIQRNSGKTTDAISTFTKLTEDYPELPEPYNNLAVLYAGQNQFDKARTALEMAIRTNPSYSTAHENLGDVYARLASQAYNKALQLDSANVAVPPKLALIRELFSTTNKGQHPSLNAVAATPAAVVVPPIAAGAPVASATTTVKSADSTIASSAKEVKPLVNDNAAKETREVEAAIRAWAKAWAAKDMAAYLSAYGKEFIPSTKQSHSTWAEERRKRIVGKSSISVKLENLTVNIKGSRAFAKFRQNYRADALAISSHKTLELEKIGRHWFIVKESVGN